MSTSERAKQRGRRLGRELRRKVGNELRIARLAAGLSQRSLGGLVGRSHSVIGRIERGEAGSLTIEMGAVMSAVLGMDLHLALFPTGTPVRDAGHLALIARLRGRISSILGWRTEVPVPLPGDLRSADVVIGTDEWSAMVEAETRLGDLQALDRRMTTKQRDLGCTRSILLVADSRHDRAVLAAYPELRLRFPVSTRACLRALRDGRDPGGDALVIL